MSIYNKLGATMSAAGSTTWTGMKAGASAAADTATATGSFIKNQDYAGVAKNAGAAWGEANKASQGYLNATAVGMGVGASIGGAYGGLSDNGSFVGGALGGAALGGGTGAAVRSYFGPKMLSSNLKVGMQTNAVNPVS